MLSILSFLIPIPPACLSLPLHFQDVVDTHLFTLEVAAPTSPLLETLPRPFHLPSHAGLADSGAAFPMLQLGDGSQLAVITG